jgi:hypothetical protein
MCQTCNYSDEIADNVMEAVDTPGTPAKFRAIKVLRNACQMGLKDAKFVIESLMDSYNAHGDGGKLRTEVYDLVSYTQVEPPTPTPEANIRAMLNADELQVLESSLVIASNLATDRGDFGTAAGILSLAAKLQNMRKTGGNVVVAPF